MTNNLKPGDKFLLPVTFDCDGEYLGPLFKTGLYCIDVTTAELDTLIPASTLTDLQAENDRLKTALSDIASMLEQFARPSVRYVALKALGRDV